MKYKICKKCGSNLDFGEVCDCEYKASEWDYEMKKDEKTLNVWLLCLPSIITSIIAIIIALIKLI